MKKMTMTMRVLVAVGLALALLFPSLPMADAATGNVARHIDSRPPCPSGTDVTSAFDGTNLWYSCSANTPDVYRYGVGAWEFGDANSTSANTPDVYRYGVGTWEFVERKTQ